MTSERITGRSAIGFSLVLFASAVLVWGFGRAELIATDWHGWRQADTQVIALHFTEPGSHLLYPRIDWGGSGPGYVEAEFQLYTWLISRLLLVVGDAEWPGQLISLLAASAAVAVLWRALFEIHGAFAAALGALTLLTSRSVMYVSTAVQPEALCLLFYVLGWTSFLRYEKHGNRTALVAFAGFGALSMLVKPTAAQLGVSAFVFLSLSSPKRLRSVEPWIAWATMLILLGAHLVHAREVYEDYGNSFGVLAGSGSKISAGQFLSPGLWLGAATKSVIWGLGPLGALALLFIVVRRRWNPTLVALLVGNAVWTLLAVRVTSGAAGTHYHVLTSVLAAHAVALTVEELSKHRHVRTTLAAVWVAAFSLTLLQRAKYAKPLAPEILAVAREIDKHARPGTLVVVRSMTERYTTDFHTLANYQDPRIHYLSRTRGWIVPLDEPDPTVLLHLAGAGARFYVESEPVPNSATLDEWLARNAALVARTPFGGRVFRL